MDRQLEETLNHGPNPPHPQSMFGIRDTNAMQYADLAKALAGGDTQAPA